MTNCIVFIPGLWGGDELDIQVEIPLALSRLGVNFHVLDAPDDVEIQDAARRLDVGIKSTALVHGQGIHLVGHSMGGLIGRYYLTHVWDESVKILSFTTLACPHLGTPFAGDSFAFFDRAIDDLSYRGVEKFNSPASPDYCPPHPKVPQYSYGAKIPGFWTALRRGTLWELWLHRKLGRILEEQGFSSENDSVVPTFSQRWGTYLGAMEVSHRYFSLKTGYQNPDVVKFFKTYFDFLEAAH